ncbi:hypothetical protein I7N24_08600 [Neisseria meningitidis]|uniref:hypothetical protein n=1 Tax=Neisseria meningitidis TaxID=487 RepID=UPI0013DFB2E9|nr:hypothetical protein [Neisseria meningitidis]MBH2182150.1 hypothetical protein [Neisseria meningitidis]MBH2224970.1 hypothetical protein [Neisseria meningitidis]MBH2238148.1 hypothetical protein [Neisseria meningitidis]MBH2402713.1 hypothetical protein [Neisseria meningitidis]MBH2445681.1 hypothetical protein [Neisseria meningitidis]
MSSSKLILSSSYWRIYKKSDYCVLSFYQFVIGQAHEFFSVGIFSNLYEAFVCIDSSGSDFPVVITTDGCGFSFDF